jgi:hypothetical protein
MKREITRYVLECDTVLKGQDRSFEASWKSAIIEHSRVEVEKHLYGLHRGFASQGTTRYGSLWTV